MLIMFTSWEEQKQNNIRVIRVSHLKSDRDQCSLFKLDIWWRYFSDAASTCHWRLKHQMLGWNHKHVSQVFAINVGEPDKCVPDSLSWVSWMPSSSCSSAHVWRWKSSCSLLKFYCVRWDKGTRAKTGRERCLSVLMDRGHLERRPVQARHPRISLLPMLCLICSKYLKCWSAQNNQNVDLLKILKLLICSK